MYICTYVTLTTYTVVIQARTVFCAGLKSLLGPGEQQTTLYFGSIPTKLFIPFLLSCQPLYLSVHGSHSQSCTYVSITHGHFVYLTFAKSPLHHTSHAHSHKNICICLLTIFLICPHDCRCIRWGCSTNWWIIPK